MIKRIYYAILRFLELDKSNHRAGDIRLQGQDEYLHVPAFVNTAKEQKRRVRRY